MFNKSKKNKKINKKHKTKKTYKFNGGGNNVANPKCNPIIDLPEEINLSNILLKSNECKIKALITFQGITLNITIFQNVITFQMGENNNINCIEFEIKKESETSELKNYFNRNDKLECIEKFQNKKEINQFFFDLFDAINIEMNLKKCTLEDVSELKLNMCSYDLHYLKMMESGYGFYNKFGFFYNVDIIKMNTILLKIKEKAEMNIKTFFAEFLATIKSKKKEMEADIKQNIKDIFELYSTLKLGIINNDSFNNFYNTTKMSVLCKYILEICNQEKNIATQEKIKEIINDYTLLIIKKFDKLLKTDYGINPSYKLQKIYNNTTKQMSLFDKITSTFKFSPYKKNKFDIKYIDRLKVYKNNNNKLNNANNKIYESGIISEHSRAESIFHITIT